MRQGGAATALRLNRILTIHKGINEELNMQKSFLLFLYLYLCFYTVELIYASHK